MAKYANQKEIVVNKIIKNNNFLVIDNNDWMTAFKTLSPSGFGLYLYLARINTTVNGWCLSRADVKDKLGISDTTYDRAVKDLVDNGYMTKIEGNKYNIIVSPKMGIPENGDNIIPKNGEENIPENGESINIKNNKKIITPHTSCGALGECPETPRTSRENVFSF